MAGRKITSLFTPPPISRYPSPLTTHLYHFHPSSISTAPISHLSLSFAQNTRTYIFLICVWLTFLSLKYFSFVFYFPLFSLITYSFPYNSFPFLFPPPYLLHILPHLSVLLLFTNRLPSFSVSSFLSQCHSFVSSPVYSVSLLAPLSLFLFPCLLPILRHLTTTLPYINHLVSLVYLF